MMSFLPIIGDANAKKAGHIVNIMVHQRAAADCPPGELVARDPVTQFHKVEYQLSLSVGRGGNVISVGWQVTLCK